MAAAKKALWNPHGRRLVQDSLEGLVAAVPHLRRLDGFPEVKVVVDAEHDRGKVACISGGGSGHEPAHAGFVGRGMLAAAVCGEVFASPSAEAVLAAIHAVSPSPALLIVKNYTGDRLNFGVAAEAARAGGSQVEVVVVGEDTAISAPGLAGRRGLAGTAYVHKVAGAAAMAGGSLKEVADAARAAAASMGTLGVALSVCSVPGAPPSTRLGPEDIELGLGIHGEPGYETAPWAPLDRLVPAMLTRILDFTCASSGANTAALRSGAPLALLANNLGGSSSLELGAVVHEALGWLAGQGIDVRRVHAGAVVTSLDMAGVSLTLMACDDARLAALDAPTAAPGWPALGGAADASKPLVPLPAAVLEARARRAELLAGRPLASAAPGGRAFDAAVRAAAAALAVAAVVRGAVGGSAGGLYNLGLTAAAGALPRHGPVGPQQWAGAMAAGLAAVGRYGNAAAGSRTMLDALLPAADALAAAAAAGKAGPEAAAAAAAAAAAGAEATKGMAAAVGRASYTRGAALAGADPGAVAVATWLAAVADALARQPA
ncbi:MAG: dihydroxyacetone kinase family protein [Monoraphidium minutum]|nr:MAG: dihydroxyacetone kinase family protein [Monoraphidium minutum]